MPTRTRTLADIEAEQERLATKAERIRAEADEARRVEAERLEAERDQEARDLLASYDDTALDGAVVAAEQRLRRAIVDDPVHAAAIDLLAARILRYEQSIDAHRAAQRLGQSAPANAPVAALTLSEHVDQVIRSEASIKAEDTREMKG